MSNPYRELFLAPGAAGFVAACAVARLALPMIGIGIITMLSQVRGAYTLAGAVAATFALATRCSRRAFHAWWIATGRAGCCRWRRAPAWRG